MKHKTIRIKSLLFVFLSLFVFTANAESKSDLAKEKRWEAQIVPGIIVGEDVKLTANGVEFLALYTEPTTDQSKGAVILLHGIGVHPAWPEVIEPLRMQLPDNGWHTLSLQMPILHNTATDKDYALLFPEVPVRVQAGVDFIKAKGIKNIIVGGHSLGATMASYYMATNHDLAVTGLALLGGGFGIPKDSYMDSLQHFRNIKGVRIVDVHGSEDRKDVFQVIGKRKALAKKHNNKQYQPLQIKGSDHFYRGKEAELVSQLSSWLEKK